VELGTDVQSTRLKISLKKGTPAKMPYKDCRYIQQDLNMSVPLDSDHLNLSSTAHPALCPQERFLLFFAYDQTAPVERGGVFGVPTVDVGLPRGREEVS
jgi:hypothetical protein